MRTDLKRLYVYNLLPFRSLPCLQDGDAQMDASCPARICSQPLTVLTPCDSWHEVSEVIMVSFCTTCTAHVLGT